MPTSGVDLESPSLSGQSTGTAPASIAAAANKTSTICNYRPASGAVDSRVEDGGRVLEVHPSSHAVGQERAGPLDPYNPIHSNRVCEEDMAVPDTMQ